MPVTRIISTILLIVCLFAQIRAQQTSGIASFLGRGMSARSVGLGGAYTAIVQDPSAVYWNPAGLCLSKGISLQLSDYKDWRFSKKFSDVNYPQIATSFSPNGSILGYLDWGIGVGLSGFFVQDISMYDNASNYIGESEVGEMVFYFSNAFRYETLSLGITYKYVYQNFPNVAGYGGSERYSSMAGNKKGVDFGILFKPLKYVTLGMTIMDHLRVNSEEYIPRIISAGMGFASTHWIISADYLVKEDSFDRIRAGVEYKYNAYAIRMGIRDFPLNKNFAQDKTRNTRVINTKIAIGTGYTLKLGDPEAGHELCFDFALQQETWPSLGSPLSRIVATSVTYK